jgi:hypothetical protein
LTVPVFIAPLPSPVTVALIWSLLGWRMTTALVGAALAGRADQPRRTVVHGTEPACANERRHASGRVRRALPGAYLAAETLAFPRHVICYFIAGMLAAAVTTLLPRVRSQTCSAVQLDR